MSAIAHQLGIKSFIEDDFPPVLEIIFNLSKQEAEKVSTFTYPFFREHFEKNEQEILRSAAGLNGSILIFVTDGGFDVPIKKLAEQFDQVKIAAIHRSSALSAVEKVSLEDRRKVDVCVTDFTGWVKQFWQKIHEIGQNPPSTHRIPELTTQIPLVINPEGRGYDFVVSSCTASCIISPLKEYLSLFFSDVSPFSNFLDPTEEKHLDLLAGLAKRTGRVFASLPVSNQCFSLFNQPENNATNLLNPHVVRRFRDQFKNCSAAQWEWNIPDGRHFDKVQILAMSLSNKH